MNPEWVGSIAAILTTAAYVPQTVRILRYKHTQSISLWMYVLITGGIGCWFIYGVMMESPSMMVANGLSFIMSVIILTMKLRYG